MLRIRVHKHHLALHSRHGEFIEVLRPGVHYLPARLLPGHHVQAIDTRRTRFDHEVVATLEQDSPLREHLFVVDLTDEQRGIVWKDGRVDSMLGPGRYAFWREPYTVYVETIEVGEGRLEHPKLEAILAHRQSNDLLQTVRAGAHEEVRLYRDGAPAGALRSGVASFWRGSANVTWHAYDLREQVADVAGQEIMTADKVSLRVNLVVTYRIVDSELVARAVTDPAQALYRHAQLALRATVGARTLDQLLADKEAVGHEVRDAVQTHAATFGVEVRATGLRDVILPGEMKTILNQVIEAEKRAEADVVRRREETAAARSQANTARLLAANPALARMKELEALQSILSGSNATFVLGQGDVLHQLRGLTPRSSDTSEA